MSAPIAFNWDGESMVPLGRFAKLADREFVIGQSYVMVEHQERSRVSHDHYFAVMQDAWANLPEVLSDQFPTSETLRKYCLIKAGYADCRTFVASSKAEAARIATFIKPGEEYSVIIVQAAVVSVYTARSQSMKAMGKQAFQDSKTAVLDILAEMLGIGTDQLTQQAGKAA